MENNLHFLGNQELLKLHKIAFLSSDKFSATSVLKSYDWATEMKQQNQCVISGFQSKLECDVLDILLKGTQPIIIALARGIYKKTPTNLKPHIDSGRLLIISQFQPNVLRASRAIAYKRNRLIIDLADSVVIAHVYSGGMIERLIGDCGKDVMILDR